MNIDFTDLNLDSDTALYIHWPFCEKKCPYCDFNSHVRDDIDNDKYFQKYLQEIEFYGRVLSKRKIKSIFFGGGTPGLMSARYVDQIIDSICKNFQLTESIEISIEANPASSEARKFSDFSRAGVNRLSLGVQSFDDKNLKFLGRLHSADEARKAIEEALNIFDNFSFDLIYALDNQTLAEWQKELQIAMQYQSPHISLYQLTIEKGTEFYRKYNAGKLKIAEEDLANDMYFFTKEYLAQYDLNQYEISNYAKQGFECQHNLNYWQYNDYLGIGAGSHSRLKSKDAIFAFYEIHNPEKWFNDKNPNPIQKFEKLDDEEIIQEILFMGLRSKNGIDLSKFNRFFSKDISSLLDESKIAELEKADYLLYEDKQLKLLDKGYSLHTAICSQIIS
jgi:oxygen-independent coproporphyrinogen-3 oxidase